VTRLISGACRAASALLFTMLAACGNSSQPVVSSDAAASPSPSGKTLTSGVELANFDKSVRPQDDFYKYVNGTWLQNTPIPPDKASYGSFTQLYDLSQERLRTIIEESSNKPDKTPGTDEQKVGDLYASFMDE